jgi:hypothetical protein
MKSSSCRITIHIILSSSTDTKCPRYEKTVDFDVTKENVREIINRRLTLKIGENRYVITFTESDRDDVNGTLRAYSRMRDPACKAYIRAIEADGWRIMSQTDPQLVTSSGR